MALYDEIDQTSLTAQTWPIGTRVTLCNVPWDAQYRDIVAWDNAQEQSEYFDGLIAKGAAWTNDTFAYLEYGKPVCVRLPYAQAYKYNYCVVTNPQLPVTGDQTPPVLYYFITACTRRSPEAVSLSLQLDVVQTRQFSLRLGGMFVESGHVAMSNTNIAETTADMTGEQLRNYLTVPEGLDCGREYAIAGQEYVYLGKDDGSLGYTIIISTISLFDDPGTVQSPKITMAKGSSPDGLPSGCDVYVVKPGDFSDVMLALKDKSWVAQGIVSITTLPAVMLPPFEDDTIWQTIFNGSSGHIVRMNNFIRQNPKFDTHNIFDGISRGLADAYKGVKKLYAYPYSVIELTCFNGNSIFLKPELVNGSKLTLAAMLCTLAPFARMGVYPDNYGRGENSSADFTYTYKSVGSNSAQTGVIRGGDFLDTCLWISDFPQFSIVNNNYITYMASTVNTRNYQYQSAGWSLDRSNAAAKLGWEQSAMQRATESANFGLGQAQQQRANNLQAVMGGASALGNLATGNVGGALAGAATTATNYMLQQSGMATQRAQLANTQLTQSEMADQNLQYAQYAANGDYKNQIAGINATVQDAALTPPSTVGQMGGQGFNWANGLLSIVIRYKTISGAAQRTVGDYFLRYGYNVRRFLSGLDIPLADLKCMQEFSYWKVSAVSIRAMDGDETERDAMRGILEKGVTIWGNPDSISDINITNNAPRRNWSY